MKYFPNIPISLLSSKVCWYQGKFVVYTSRKVYHLRKFIVRQSKKNYSFLCRGLVAWESFFRWELIMLETQESFFFWGNYSSLLSSQLIANKSFATTQHKSISLPHPLLHHPSRASVVNLSLSPRKVFCLEKLFVQGKKKTWNIYFAERSTNRKDIHDIN